MKRVDAIFVGDLHLREQRPICRTDDWLAIMKNKLVFIRKLASKHGCDVFCSGDVFHTWDSSPFLISFAIQELPQNMRTVAGNHDLPKHSMELFDKSALYTLVKANKVIMRNGDGPHEQIPYRLFNYGDKLENGKGLAVCHTFVYKGGAGETWERGIGVNAGKVMDALKGFNTILVGDNHQNFEVRRGNQLLINVGSLFRMTSAQKDHKPCVYLWNTDNEFEKVTLPIDRAVVSDEHIIEENEKDERMTVFVERMRKDIEVGLDFEKNMEEYLAKNNVKQGVIEKIREVMK